MSNTKPGWDLLNRGGQTHYGAANDLSDGAFGPKVSVGLKAQVNAFLARAHDDRVWKQFAKLSGSVSVSNGEGVLSTGTTQYAYMTIQTRTNCAYQPGSGLRGAWTARFPTGEVLNGYQVAGPLHGEAGLAIGYPGDGTGFGFMHRRGRRFEVQKFVVDVAASGAETVTITLSGTAHAVPVTAGTVQHNAKEIAEYASGYTDSSGLVDYDPYAVDDVVYFIRQTHGVPAGAYTDSSTGTLDGTWSQFQAGANGTETWYPQTGWSIDKCDGFGVSGVTIDPTLGNIWVVRWGWLGYLGPVLFVADPKNQRFVPCHFVPWSGTSATADGTSITDPRLPMIYAAASLGSTTDIQVAGASCVISLEDGVSPEQGPGFSEFRTRTGVGTTEVPILAIMCSPLYFRGGHINRRRLILESVDVANVGLKDVEIRIYLGTQANLVGAVFTTADIDEALLVDVSATGLTGTMEVLEQTDLPIDGVRSGPLHREPYIIFRGEVIIVTAVTTSSSTTVTVGMLGHEDP